MAKLKLGKIEKRILDVLERPYPLDPSADIKVGTQQIYSYPLHGSDTKHLVELIFNYDKPYLDGSSQVSMSRALARLHRKGLIARMKPERDWLNRRFTTYRLDARLENPDAKVTRLPHSTKVWWILPKHLNEAAESLQKTGKWRPA